MSLKTRRTWEPTVGEGSSSWRYVQYHYLPIIWSSWLLIAWTAVHGSKANIDCSPILTCQCCHGHKWFQLIWTRLIKRLIYTYIPDLSLRLWQFRLNQTQHRLLHNYTFSTFTTWINIKDSSCSFEFGVQVPSRLERGKPRVLCYRKNQAGEIWKNSEYIGVIIGLHHDTRRHRRTGTSLKSIRLRVRVVKVFLGGHPFLESTNTI